MLIVITLFMRFSTTKISRRIRNKKISEKNRGEKRIVE